MKVRDATCWSDADPVGETHIRLGEAAFSIDPPSFAGVQKALQTALCGSAVVHTLLSGKGDRDAALAFYGESHRHSVQQHARWAARSYRDNERFREQPFWRWRAPAPVEPTLSER